jgi:hypothetical protein
VNPLLKAACRAFENVLEKGALFACGGSSVVVKQDNSVSWAVASISTKGVIAPASSSAALAYILAWALNEMADGRGPVVGYFGVVTKEDVGKRVMYVSSGGEAVEFGVVVDVGAATGTAFVDFGSEVPAIKACKKENLARCDF